MASSLNSRHIPTLLGVLILIGGLVGGIFLANSATTGFLPRASPETTPKSIKITNVTDTSFTVSWITDSKTTGYVKYGLNPSSITLTSTDDRDQLSGSTALYSTHHVTIRGLTASTPYYYKIGSSSTFLYDNNGQPYQTSTIAPITANAKTMYGQVLSSSQSGVGGAIVYVTGDDMAPLSTVTQSSGNFVLSLSQARTKSLSSAAILTDSTRLDIFVQGIDTATSVIKATLSQAQPLPEIVIGTNQDLTNTTAAPVTTVSQSTPAPDVQSKFTAQLLAPPTETTVSAQLISITFPTGGEIVSKSKPTFTGLAPKSTKLLLKVDGPTILSTTLTASSLGKWTYTPTKALLAGSYTLSSTATISGQIQTDNIGFSIVLPTAAPTASPSAGSDVVNPSTASGQPVTGSSEMTIILIAAGILLVGSGIAFTLAEAENAKLPS